MNRWNNKQHQAPLHRLLKLCAGCAMLLLASTSCSSSDPIDTNHSVIVDRQREMNDFDRWLEVNYLKPYNIELKYKFDDNESDRRYNLAPADYQKSVQFAHLTRHLCLEAYDEVTGTPGNPDKTFIRQLFPKVVHLIGSTGYDPNGKKTLGTAEGGRKMTLYRINELDPANIRDLNTFYFQTMHHEFGHIQNQTKPYPAEFRQITASDYRSDTWGKAWGEPSNIHSVVYEELDKNRSKALLEYKEVEKEYYTLLGKPRNAEEERLFVEYKRRKEEMEKNESLKEERKLYERRRSIVKKLHAQEINALRAGFISTYASSQHYEDFVEVQATFITDAPELWETKMFIAGERGRDLLQAKFNIVSQYLQNDWGIDIYALRDCVQRRQKEIKGLDLNSVKI